MLPNSNADTTTTASNSKSSAILWIAVTVFFIAYVAYAEVQVRSFKRDCETKTAHAMAACGDDETFEPAIAGQSYWLRSWEGPCGGHCHSIEE